MKIRAGLGWGAGQDWDQAGSIVGCEVLLGKGNTCRDSFETKEQHTEENQPTEGTSRIEPFPVFRQPQVKCFSHLATTENKLEWCGFHKWLISIAYLRRCWPDFPSALMQTHMTYSLFVHVLSVMVHFVSQQQGFLCFEAAESLLHWIPFHGPWPPIQSPQRSAPELMGLIR